MLRNLIANAVAYAPAGSEIFVVGRVIKGEARIEIRNEAPDLSPEDLLRFGEPFWRKDTARSNGEHAGLGFPLALAYATNLGLAVSPTLSGGRLSVVLGSHARMQDEPGS